MPSRIARNKPLISLRNQAKRLKWAEKHKKWSISKWKKVIFSEETPGHMVQYHQERRVRCFRSQILSPQNIRPNMHSNGAKVSVWSCFYGLKIGPVIQIPDKMRASDYINVVLEPFLDEHFQRRIAVSAGQCSLSQGTNR